MNGPAFQGRPLALADLAKFEAALRQRDPNLLIHRIPFPVDVLIVEQAGPAAGPQAGRPVVFGVATAIYSPEELSQIGNSVVEAAAAGAPGPGAPATATAAGEPAAPPLDIAGA